MTMRAQCHHAAREAAPKAVDQLGREGDLRHQHQGLAVGGDRRRNGAQVHLGLAAAGDPVEQVHGKFGERGQDGFDGFGLRGGQRQLFGLGRGPRQCGRGRLAGSCNDPAAPCEGLQVSGFEGLRYIRRRGRAALRHPGQQRPLLRSASIARLLQLRDSKLREGPVFDRFDGGLARAQACRERRREHLADGVVVVVRRPREQLERDRVENRDAVQHLEYAAKLGRRDARVGGMPHQHADFYASAERYAHAHPRRRGSGRVGKRQVIEDATQRRVERDVPNQASSFVHKSCG